MDTERKKSEKERQNGPNINIWLALHAGPLQHHCVLITSQESPLLIFIDTMWLECVKASDPIRFTDFSCRIGPVGVMVKSAESNVTVKVMSW